MKRKRIRFKTRYGFVSFLSRKRKKKSKSSLYREFEKEKKEHPTLPHKIIWQIVYDHHKK